MAVTAPKIDGRDSDAILREARALAPLYTPEWKAEDEDGGGAALLKIFARLLEGVIRRLNDAPLKHYIAFLEMIGVKLLPAVAARAPLTFLLSKGTKEAVTVPARSQAAAAAADGGDPIVFETERAILATPAKLLSVHSVVPRLDHVFEHLAALTAGTQTELFADGDNNLQAHELYLGHAELFNIKSAVRIELTVTTPSRLLASDTLVVWEYCVGEKEEIVDGEPVKSLAWSKFDDVSGEVVPVKDVVKEPQKFNVVLVKKNDDELKQVKVNEIKSRWIRCVVTEPLLRTDALAALAVGDISVKSSPLPEGQTAATSGTTGAAALAATRFAPGAGALLARSVAKPAEQPAPAGIDPDAAFYNDLPLKVPPSDLKPLYPFGPPPRANVPGERPRPGDTFYLASQEAFSKRGATVTLQVNAPPAGAVERDVERVHGIGPVRASRLKAANINTTADLLKLSVEETARIIQDRGASLAWTKDLREAAAKNYFDRVVTAGPEVEPDPDRVIPELSWEYWNGGGWLALEDVLDGTAALTLPGALVFTCPEDIALVKVLGQENYWIRARIAFGDYGQERFTVNNPTTNPTVVFNTSGIKPPRLTSLKVSYSVAGVTPNYVLTLNNLQYDSVPVDAEKGGLASAFKPFGALEDEHQGLYFGFDLAPLKGPISLFFALKEQEYADENRPRIEWEYFRLPAGGAEGEWARLLVTDGTKNLTQSGVIEFIGPSDFTPERLFGQTLFWIRAVDVEDKFTPLAAAAANSLALAGTASGGLTAATAKRREVGLRLALSALLRDRGRLSLASLKSSLASDAQQESSERARPADDDAVPPPADPCGCKAGPCSESLETLDLPFVGGTVLAGTAPAPVFTGVYLNTAWGVQSETIRDEILGSSAGIADQRYTLTKFPVVAEEVWVDELATLTESERKTLAETAPDKVREAFDDAGNLTRFYIRWSATDDLAEAGATDRVYIIDRTFGQVQFGDGVHGTVPPIGKDNIVATYRAGGGSRGNVAAGLVVTLRTTIPFVESVLNPAAAGGGSDTELVESAVVRGPRSIKHRGRAVTAEDFEQLAREASQSVARVKALPLFNDRGEYETNWVTVIIVPGSADARPTPSPQLRYSVEQYLRERAASGAAFLKQVKVSGPAYVEVTVGADIYAASIDLAPQVEAAAVATLEAFLHPLTGGYTQSGWDFGRLPCLSDFYALLEAVPGMDHIENLRMTLSPVTPGGAKAAEPRVVTEDRPLDVVVPVYTLVYSGEHKFEVKALA
ncbi:MAG: putative baseplate assembly protein [Pyrinomonadaceae bacterium]